MSNGGDSLFDQVAKRRRRVKLSKSAPFWGGVHALIVLVLFLELKYAMVSGAINIRWIRYIFVALEFLMTLVVLVKALENVYLFVWMYIWMEPIVLTSSERVLLRVKDDEIGFKSFVAKPANEIKNTVESPVKKTLAESPNFSISPSQVLTYNRSSLMSNTSLSSTPGAWAGNTSSPNVSMNSSSWCFQQTGSASMTPSSVLRKRVSGYLQNHIKDEGSLNEYLQKYDETEEKLELYRETEKKANTTDLFNQSTQQPSPQRMNYQSADDSSVLGSDSEMTTDESSGLSPLRSKENIMSKFGCTDVKLNECVQNLRSYISRTIFHRLVKEIDTVNELISKTGEHDSLIGEGGLSSIKLAATLKSKQIPSLSVLLPFLEISQHQEYLVARIRDLAKGSCLTEYNWNAGTMNKSRQWSEDLPTDAAIVMNAFAAYMDSRLPSALNCPEGNAFSWQYFKQINANNLDTLSSIYICETKKHPPHYKVVYNGEDVCEVPSGRNNLFYAILLFLHHVKIKKHALLGRTNLGSSGVNVLWVLE